VFQDLATVPLMSLWRNFFPGQEPARGRGPLRRLDIGQARTIMRDELMKMGIDVRDPNQLMGLTAGAGAPDPELVEVARTLAEEAPAASEDGATP
jgi:simple sugar transport system ATP-binding protein